MTELPATRPLAERFRINAPHVALQIIDGEAILIHFERGHYFSARGFGCEILRQCARGSRLGDVSEQLAQRSGAEPSAVRAAITGYAERLLAEDLITAEEAGPVPLEGADEGASGPLEFGEPELVKYTDLEDLLLLDPIHDVDEVGWPPLPAAPFLWEPST